MIKKIPMIYRGEIPEKEHFVDIEEMHYKTYRKILLRSGFDWPKNLTEKRACIYIPQSWIGYPKDGKIVGVCAASFGGLKHQKAVPNSAEIEGLAVLPEYRRQGIGSKLTKGVIRILYDNGYEHVYVSVWAKRKDAVKTYLKVGFIPIKGKKK